MAKKQDDEIKLRIKAMQEEMNNKISQLNKKLKSERDKAFQRQLDQIKKEEEKLAEKLEELYGERQSRKGTLHPSVGAAALGLEAGFFPAIGMAAIGYVIEEFLGIDHPSLDDIIHEIPELFIGSSNKREDKK